MGEDDLNAAIREDLRRERAALAAEVREERCLMDALDAGEVYGCDVFRACERAPKVTLSVFIWGRVDE